MKRIAITILFLVVLSVSAQDIVTLDTVINAKGLNKSEIYEALKSAFRANDLRTSYENYEDKIISNDSVVRLTLLVKDNQFRMLLTAKGDNEISAKDMKTIIVWLFNEQVDAALKLKEEW